MKRLVLLGDSLGLPRPMGNEGLSDALEYEETYPYLLKRLLPEWDVISVFKRGNRTDKQANPQCLYDDIVCYKPDAVVIHLGICDCAPRLFSKLESFILTKLPYFIRKHIINIFSSHRYFFTKVFKKVYVKKIQFQNNFKIIANEICKRDCMLIIIGIADTNDMNKRKSYGYEKNIIEYNRILVEISDEFGCSYVDMFNEGDGVIFSDGIHLNKEGCNIISKRIFSILTDSNS